MSDILSSNHQTSASLGKVDIGDSNGAPASGPGSGPAPAPGERSVYSSPESSPEHDQDHDLLPDHELDHRTESQPQKRKGGRKPIYATSEERKQRNRQAQAAFRERRTEYIKQLESTIKVHEENLQNLQASHRNAADECLMLRYKNSLLERILIEKGIDVQSELRAKTSSPNLVPTRVPQGPPSAPMAASPVSRFPSAKFANRRSLSALPAKVDGIQTQGNGIIHRSPLSQPTSASHLSSPIAPLAKSPNFMPQQGPHSPSFGPPVQQSQQLRPQQLRPQFNPPGRAGFVQHPLSSAVSSASGGSSGSALSGSSAGRGEPQNYYPSPFQNHYEQLEQEYEAQADMLDDQDPSEHTTSVPTFPTSYSATGLPPAGISQPLAANPNTTQAALQAQPEAGAGAPFGNGMANGAIFDPYDPMLDADPFGLSASMHFPTQFSFDAQR